MAGVTQRIIGAALQTHLDGSGTTLCWLLKITTRHGAVVGLTSLDRDVAYDDGSGLLTYSAAIGAELEALEWAGNLEVNNTDTTIIIDDTGTLTAKQLDAGILDYARFVLYRINWADLSQGHIKAMVGRTGAAKVINQVKGIIELRGLPQILKQNFVQLYSLTCRARFGSGGDSTTCIVTGQCGFDADALWQSNTISAVDADEPDRVFTVVTTPSATGPNGALSFAPGLVRWTAGDNANTHGEIESVAGNVITLRFPMPWDIQLTDTLDARPDCDKLWRTCTDDYDNNVHFRGEYLIPVSEESAARAPGAIAYPAYPIYFPEIRFIEQ